VACKELDAVTYPDEAFAKELEAQVVPVKVNVLEQRELCRRMNAFWTPITAFVDGSGAEHHRFIGYLPPEEFAPQVHFARGREAFSRGEAAKAKAAYQAVVERWPGSDCAPEALYWTGVCDFRLTKEMPRILEACREVVRRYPGHIWAKKLGFVR
jgi:hypothetical protein